MSQIIPTQSNSKSLWNYTLYRGWTMEDVEVLKVALIKYGFGQWDRLIKSNCLPGKTPIQMYHQTQRLIGQQSLSKFKGLHVNLQQIFLDNQSKRNVFRKNNFIINEGDNQTGKMINQSLKENKRKYGYPPEYYKDLKLPRTLSNSIGPHLTIKQITDSNNHLTVSEKIDELKNLISCMKKKLEIFDIVELGRKRQREIKREEEEERLVFELQNNLTLNGNDDKAFYPYRKVFDKEKSRYLKKRKSITKKITPRYNNDTTIDYEVIRIKKSDNGYQLLE